MRVLVFRKRLLSLKDGKELFQGKTIMGGMKNRSGVFVNGSHEEVRDEVRKVVEEAGRKGFILGADCTLFTGQDLSKIRTAVESARAL